MIQRIAWIGLVLMLTVGLGWTDNLPITVNHGGDARSVAFSPDGKTFLSASGDHTAKLWDAKTGTELKTFAGHTSVVYSAKFFPDGSKIITTSADRTIKIWDVTSDTSRTLTGINAEVLACDVSPDGQMVAACGGEGDCSVVVWNTQTGEQIARYARNGALYIGWLTFSKDGSKLVSAATQANSNFTLPIQVRNTTTWQSSGEIDGGIRFSLSHDGMRIVTKPNLKSNVNTASIKELSTGNILLTLVGHSAPVSCFAYSPDDKQVLTGSTQNDGAVRLWDATTGKCLHVFTGLWQSQGRGVADVCFSSDGKLVLIAGFNGVISLLHNPFAPNSVQHWLRYE